MPEDSLHARKPVRADGCRSRPSAASRHALARRASLARFLEESRADLLLQAGLVVRHSMWAAVRAAAGLAGRDVVSAIDSEVSIHRILIHGGERKTVL